MSALELKSEWIHCLAVVLFDLDIGHQLEQCYPRDALSVAEQGDVAFHAFPVCHEATADYRCPLATCSADSSMLCRTQCRWNSTPVAVCATGAAPACANPAQHPVLQVCT